MDFKIKIQLLIALFPLFCLSQKTTLPLAPKDYGKWSTLSGEKISPDGKWVVYKVMYESGIDTSFLHEIKTAKRQAFPQASDITFSPDSNWYALQTADGSLTFKSVTNHTSGIFANVSKFEFSANGKYAFVLSEEAGEKNLLLLSAPDKIELVVKNATEFKQNPYGQIAVVSKSGLTVYDTKRQLKATTVFSDTTKQARKPVWNKKGNKLAFFIQEINSGNATASYNIAVSDWAKGKIQTLKKPAAFKNDISIPPTSTPLLFSEDGSKIFFYSTPEKSTLASDEFVEVWDAATPYEYPMQRHYENKSAKIYLSMWNVATGDVTQLANEDFEKVYFIPGSNFALKYNLAVYEPQYEESAPTDYYLVNLETGDSSLLLKKHDTDPYAINVSPLGRYLSYFKEENWYIYDLALHTERKVAANLGTAFINSEIDVPGVGFSYRSPGFTNDDRYLVIYDKYDIYLIATSSNKATKITNGHKDKIRFRLESELYFTHPQTPSSYMRHDFDLQKGIIINAIGNNKSSGYFIFTQKYGLKKLVWSNSLVSQIHKAINSDQYIYQEQTSAMPPVIKMLNYQNKKEETVFQSNPHYKNYQPSKAELLSYTSSEGKELQAILHYPNNFIAGKKYPMIVYIYERISQNLHRYNYPTLQHPIGFPIANYTNEGYFVLMPDITYKIGHTGNSALQCVNSALDNVLKKGFVDDKRIGLIGHSFGGYETAYIISHSDRFAAAVIGSGVSDMLKKYLTVNFETGRSENWRVEMQQYRLGISPFENMEVYIKNSPIMDAGKINTPVLNWAGKNDNAVNWEQGLELHLALRRMGKKNIFLVYPKDGHILTNKESQLDLTKRVKDWFNWYLMQDLK